MIELKLYDSHMAWFLRRKSPSVDSAQRNTEIFLLLMVSLRLKPASRVNETEAAKTLRNTTLA